MTDVPALLRGARRYPLPLLAVGGLSSDVLVQYGARNPAIGQALLLATLIAAGLPMVIATVRGMLRGAFAADIVASLAIIGAAITDEYLAGCVIVLMQSGGEALERYAVRHASASLDALLARAPRIAHRRRGPGSPQGTDTAPGDDVPLEDGPVEDVLVENVVVGDVLLVRPGEIVPVDATVLSGTAAVDESALTGEPLPVTTGPGSTVMSGSICLDGALELRATHPSSESQYEHIVRLVRTAQEEKAPIGRLADRYAVVFTPLTLLMCALAYLVTRNPAAVVAVLVVATPCPLILATPVAIISGINRAARRGIIVKSGGAIERIGQVSAVVFDKTGTLTVGAPQVERIVPLDGIPPAELLRLAAGLEQLSGHQMARALVAAGRADGRVLPWPCDVTEAAGLGACGCVEDHAVAVGSHAYALRLGLAGRHDLERALATARVDGAATAAIGVDGRVAGLVIFSDPLRPAVPALLRRLEALGVRETAMLTGDDEATARAIATAAGITTVRADLLPADKVDAVREVLGRHGTVAMVGDGINDAPALATATVGVALGAHGAAVSAEAADIVIMVDYIGRVADAVAVGQRTLRIARQSIGIGLGVSGAMMAIASVGLIPPTLGALLQEALDVAVILNALRAR